MNALPRLVVLAISLGSAVAAGAQTVPLTVSNPATATPRRVGAVARVDAGGIQGVVLDERGAPLDGAMVSALGRAAAFAVTDRQGHFSLQSLPPGAYLVRAHLGGYMPSRTRVVEVMPDGHAVSTIALRKAGPRPTGTTGQLDEPAVLAAGVGPPASTAEPAQDHDAADDHSETAWRLRHIRRSVLKDTDIEGIVADGDELSPEEVGQPEPPTFFGRMGSSIRVATSLFDDVPFTGQINLLTTGAFDSPLQLATTDAIMNHSVAYMSIGAPAGERGEWAVRGAMTQGDVASWIVAGSFLATAPSRHAYEMDLSYSAQRYDGGNPAALAAVTEGARNVGTVYGFDRWTISRSLTLGYGARYAKYDYIGGGGLFSPRLSATISPVSHLRIDAVVSRRIIAPGAEEFVPPATGLWLPPERTFSPLNPAAGFQPESANHYEIALQRDLTKSASLGFRTFYQRVDDQIVTVFGARRPGQDIVDLGHYQVGSAGDYAARGWGVSFSHAVAGRLRGTVDYSVIRAEWLSPGDPTALSVVAPSATIHRDNERLHDLTTSVQADLPETLTRVYVLYRINNGYTRDEGFETHPGAAARFDVQVNQSLPFLNFTSTEWEMLVAVRNLFRDPLVDGSVYDELLVVRPPKRIVGGLLVRF